MANTIRIKRGLKADVDKLTLVSGELAVALDTQELYVGDVNGEKQLVKGAAAGVVESAEKLSTARNIKVSGDATGSTSFDGSADATIALTLANSGVTAGSYNKVTVNAKGLVTSGENVVYTIEDIDGLEEALAAKADAATMTTELGKKADKTSLNDYYKKTETYSQTEIDAKIDAKDSLPSQENNGGKFLTTNGTEASWVDVYTEEEIDAKLKTINDNVSAKASQADLNTLSGTVAEHTGAINTINGTLTTKANSADVYNKDAVDGLLNAKANSSDVYTMTQTDNLLSAKANTADLGDLAGKDKVAESDLDSTLATKINAAATQTYVDTELAKKATVDSVNTLTQTVNGKADQATTLAGYGIGDAYTKDEVDGMVAGTFHFKGEVASFDALPNNAEEGDVYQVGDKEYAWDGDSWVELGFNVDLSAYAKSTDVANTYATITELNKKANSADVYTKEQVYTKTEADAAFMTNAEVEAKGYATTTAMNTALDGKANKATTLEGYGITDAYTKTQTDNLLKGKANTATTLAGYGIADAYTKTEIDNKVTTINNSLDTKLDATSVIDGGTFGN